jgi:hypothetical protein
VSQGKELPKIKLRQAVDVSKADGTQIATVSNAPAPFRSGTTKEETLQMKRILAGLAATVLVATLSTPMMAADSSGTPSTGAAASGATTPSSDTGAAASTASESTPKTTHHHHKKKHHHAHSKAATATPPAGTN